MSNFTVDFKGKSAIVTGAGEGMGTAIARALVAAGANVALNDLNPDRVERLTNELSTLNRGQVVGFQGDMSNRFQVSALIERARDAFGKIDFLLNCAGIYKTEPLTKVDEWGWRRQLDVNVTATFFCVQLVSRVMADEGGGVILNLASAAGHPTPIEQGIAYVTTKTGIIGMTAQAAHELAEQGVRVNAICPPPQANAATFDATVSVMLFLLSDASIGINGQALTIASQ